MPSRAAEVDAFLPTFFVWPDGNPGSRWDDPSDRRFFLAHFIGSEIHRSLRNVDDLLQGIDTVERGEEEPWQWGGNSFSVQLSKGRCVITDHWWEPGAPSLGRVELRLNELAELVTAWRDYVLSHRPSFELPFEEVKGRLDECVEAIFSALEYEFLVFPKPPGFVEYPDFQAGYEVLQQTTRGFTELDPGAISEAALGSPLVLVVLRSMLGFTPAEWGYMTTRRSGVEVTPNSASKLDRKARNCPRTSFSRGEATQQKVRALVETACRLLSEGAPPQPADKLHRLDKADTRWGLTTIRGMAQAGAPYVTLLYERVVRTSSHDPGDAPLLHERIQKALRSCGIDWRETKRGERVEGFEQAPDFIVPNELNPQVVIVARVAENEALARATVIQVQNIAKFAQPDGLAGPVRYEVIACISGRGFGTRKEDMRSLLQATRGKVFTLNQLSRLIECSQLARLVQDAPPAAPSESPATEDTRAERCDSRD